MRRYLFTLLLSGILAVAAVPAAGVAAPTDSRISVASQAQYVSATTILVAVTYVCPETGTFGGVSVSVSQAETGGAGGGFQPVPCTGEPETVVIAVNGGPFTLGTALAQGFIGGANFFSDSQRRRIQIVL